MARTSRVKPISQLSSRGLRNAPVKNTRNMCTKIATTKTSAAQWCIWEEHAAGDLEGDLEGRLVGTGHLQALEGLVRAGVGDLGHRRIEEHRQERAGEDQDDEAVERHLPEHERPVAGEELAGEEIDKAATGDALAEPVATDRAEFHGASLGRGLVDRKSTRLNS